MGREGKSVPKEEKRSPSRSKPASKKAHLVESESGIVYNVVDLSESPTDEL